MQIAIKGSKAGSKLGELRNPRYLDFLYRLLGIKTTRHPERFDHKLAEHKVIDFAKLFLGTDHL